MEGNRICKTLHTFIKQFASFVYHEWFISVNHLYHRKNISTDKVVTTTQEVSENEINKNMFININKICLENFLKNFVNFVNCEITIGKIWVSYK